MRTKRVLAAAAIAGGAGLNLVGLSPITVTADASPAIASNEPDPSGPSIIIEPAPSAPSPDISGDTGIAASTDTGAGMPGESLPDPTAGAPTDMPPIVDVPAGAPPIESTTGPADPSITGAPPNPAVGDPHESPTDLDHGCRPLWCPRPPDPPIQPPLWPTDPFWPDTSESWESTTVLPSPCVAPPSPDAAPPAQLQYGGQTVTPVMDDGLRQWGFWYLGNWVPLFGTECQTPDHRMP